MSDWIKTANVGDRVVCVKDNWGHLMYGGTATNLPYRQPMINEVLTISDIVPPENIAFGRKAFAFAFAEIERTQVDDPISIDVVWAAENFRPLNDRPTSIEVFTDMLKTTDKPLEVA
jgi:hypothetical protein